MTVGSQSLHGEVTLHRLPGRGLRRHPGLGLRRGVRDHRGLRLLRVRELRCKKAECGQNGKAVEAKVSGEAMRTLPRGEYRLANSIVRQGPPGQLNWNVLFLH